MFQIAIWIVRAVYWSNTGYYVSKAYAISMAAVFVTIAGASTPPSLIVDMLECIGNLDKILSKTYTLVHL